MKKRIFALALALCMMLSVMPTSFANGVLTLDGAAPQPVQQPQEGVLSVDGAQPREEEVPEQPVEETPVYGVLTPDQPEEKAPVVQQPVQETPVQPAPGVLSVVCDVCGYYDGYHAADCATQQPEEEPAAPEVEETPTQEQPEPVVTIPQEPVVSNYTVETVSTTRTARTLNVARNAAIYNSLSLANNEEENAVSLRKDTEGLVTNKDVSDDDNDGVYTVTLEAYTTGTVTNVSTTKPTDIVLVLDQSGSMEGDITFYTYGKTYDINTGSKYYVYENGAYLEVSWCSECKAWSRCWWLLWWHMEGAQYVPMASATDANEEHTQFYARTGSSTKSRLAALKDAATVFANSVVEQTKGADKVAGTDDDVDHQIAIVGFSSSGYNNTELLTGVTITTADPTSLINSNGTYEYPLVNGNPVAYNGAQYGSITDAQYANALQDMSKSAGKNNVENAIAALTAHGGTNTADGLSMAQGIFDNNSAEGRNRVVILFTDGSSDQPNMSVRVANSLKNSYGAVVYTIGVFEGANDTVPYDSNYDGIFSNSNQVMQGISSNYPSAQIESGLFGIESVSLGTMNPNVSEDGLKYYLEASNADALANVFQKISSQLSQATIDLDSDTVVKDIVSDAFEFPADGENLQVFTAKCLSYDDETELATWETPETLTLTADDIEVDTATKTLTVKGFDFTENFVSENEKEDGSHGKKLIITFDIVPDYSATLGGSDIATNGDDSGVYSEDALVEHFERPTTSVDVAAITPQVTSQNVYLTKTATLSEILNGTDSRINGIGNSGVDVTYTLYQVNNNGSDIEIASLEIAAGQKASDNAWIEVLGQTIQPVLDDCTDYYIVCEVTATGDDGNYSTRESTNATVHVYMPEVTFQDSTIYLSQTPDYELTDSETGAQIGNYQSVVWMHGEDEADTTTMGTAPKLVYNYTPENDNFNDCNNVNVTVAVDQGKNDEDETVLDGEYDEQDEDITTHVTFVNGANSHIGSAGEKEFTVHVLKPSFEITAPNIWADYKQSVDVDRYVTTAVTGWNDATDGHIDIPAAQGDAPTSLTYIYTVKNGEEVVTEHSVGTTDKVFTIELAGFSIDTSDCGTNWYTAPETKNFTVYVNKFDLTINKTWDDVEDCYKQDVIFTITGDYGTGEDQDIQVVIPVGKTSVKVVGLLCGQSYSVAESNPEGINWAWRFTNTQKPNVTCNVGHDVISTTEHARHTVTADFTNSNPATKWFDAIASKFNIFGKGDN